MSSFSLSSSSSAGCVAQRNVFDLGKYKTQLKEVKSSDKKNPVPPPKPVLISMPSEAGEFPVVILVHGFVLHNSFYSQLLQHIASHGFIVVAPQLYEVAGPDSSQEITTTAAIANWLTQGLKHTLPPHVQPNLNKLALAGHSRGGKTSFALALSSKTNPTLNISALIGIDPVDGMDKGKQTPPPVLTYIPNSFDLNMPVLVIGSGLGEIKKNPLFPPCAPKGVNHEDFFKECRKPALYFVVKDYGHLDMLDDETKGLRGKASYCLCKNGKSREPMRRFVGGIVVAFLKAYLRGEDGDLRGIQNGCFSLPVELQRAEFFL